MNLWDQLQLGRETAFELAQADWGTIEFLLDRASVNAFIRIRAKDDDRGKYCARVLSNVSSHQLAQIAADLAVGGRSTRMWQPGAFRVFLSHHASAKAEAARLAKALEPFAITAFVAHMDIAPASTWIDEIKNALETAHALVALVDPQFHESAWTEQEVGFAFGRQLPVIPIGFAAAPRGFLGEYQALDATQRSWGDVAVDVFESLLLDPRSREHIARALICRFEASPSLEQARENVGLLERLETGPPAPLQLWRLSSAAEGNPILKDAEISEWVADLVDRLWKWGVL